VNVNTAPAEALERVPGIGPVMARRIIRDRNARGPFKRLEELDRVSGIGPKTLTKFASYLTVGAAP
jgi:competence protein ComEA